MNRLRRIGGDRGTSLVEVLISMVLLALVSSILVTAVVSSNKLFRATDNEGTGQTDIRTTIERLGRDVRNARSLDAGATESRLVLWIDSNSDYKKQASEIVTWELVPRGDGHFDVARTVNSQTSRTARFVISDVAFEYRTVDGAAALTPPLTQAQADTIRLITSDIEYAAEANRAAAARHTVFTERMRNVS